MILSQTKFLPLVNAYKIQSCLKSFSDSLWFYYLGHQACLVSLNGLLEIGVGGSTYPLMELSENHKRTFDIIDSNPAKLKTVQDNHCWFEDSDIKTYCTDSQNLNQHLHDRTWAYLHSDGSKNHEVVLNDLEFCLEHMAPTGIFCQDDYGNNKWPTITLGVNQLLSTGKVKPLLIGDSSIWLVRSESHEWWINHLSFEPEFDWLAKITNLQPSAELHHATKFWFMSGILPNKIFQDPINHDQKQYYDNLVKYDSDLYLQMPYKNQSMLGYGLGMRKQRYQLTRIWDDLRQSHWPSAPWSIEDIMCLSDDIKNHLVHHKIDLFETY